VLASDLALNDFVAVHLPSSVPGAASVAVLPLQNLENLGLMFIRHVAEHMLSSSGVFLLRIAAKRFAPVVCFSWS